MDKDISVGLSVAEALLEFRRANGIPADDAATWTCRIGPFSLCFPNFKWRRQAILRHDLHHLVTGYPCTMRGEFQVAAWEFAAGRFPHPAATLFCLPLVAAGMVWSPRAIWSAFRAGRRGQSLYGIESTEALLSSPLHRLRRSRPSKEATKDHIADGIAFFLLVAQSILLVLTPPVLALALALVV